MYKLGKIEKPKRHIVGFILGFVTIVVLLVTGFIFYDTRNGTEATTTTAKSTVPNNVTPTTQKVEEALFTIELPKDFKLTGRNTKPFNTVTWQGNLKTTSARTLTIYIDTIPTNLAVNRLTPVMPNGDQVAAGDTSDNCSTFVGSLKITPELASKSSPTPAKWQGVNFICDLPNYIREVAGTGSSEGVNTVTITGSASGSHKYFFLYTDHTAQPDFAQFATIVNSFRAK